MAQYLGDFETKEGIKLERFTGVAEASNKNETSAILRFGAVHQIVCPVKVIDGALTPVANMTTGFGRGAAKVPAGSAIFDAYVVVKGTAATGATLDVGLAEKDGTAIDADGLVDGAAADAKGISADSVAGALINTVLAEDGYVVVDAATGTDADFANADITVIVEYI